MPNRPLLRLLALALAALVLGIPAAAGAKVVHSSAKPTLSAGVKQCQMATDPAIGGQATFVGSMPARSTSGRMEMRFTLQRATDAATGFETVAVPKFSSWVKSKAGRTGFVYKKKVVGLIGPAEYRVVVAFRWRDANGKVVHRAQRTSKPCKQADTRPNLALGKVTATAVDASTADYAVVVRNTGRTAAGEFAVTIGTGATPGIGGSAATPSQDVIGGLDAKSSTKLTIRGARCTPGSTIDVTVDPAGTVVERDETDNTVTVACPFARR
jgi:hypothetical protein